MRSIRFSPPTPGIATALLLALHGTLSLCASDNPNHSASMNDRQHYTTTFAVDRTPAEVFAAINHVRGWWAGEIHGDPDQLGAEFTYRVPGVHYSRQKVTEFVQGKKIVWHVTDADLAFAQDKAEWAGTDIVFELVAKGEGTEVRFTHVGLIPRFECYHNCSDAWSALVAGNLQQWIKTGQIQPSPWPITPSFTRAFVVDQTPQQVFDAINNVRGWWSAEIEGATDRLGEFKYHYKDIHRCTIRITHLTPGRQVAWHVVDNSFNFVKDKREWIGTDILFEITRVGDKTQLRFTHAGLSPVQECYGVCSDAWDTYINGSLRDLIVRGVGRPNQNEQLARKHGQE